MRHRKPAALLSSVAIAIGAAPSGALLGAAFPASAQANSYDVYACYAGQGTYLNPGDSAASWTLSDNNGSAYYDPFDQCGATFNGFGVISRSGYYAPAGDYGEVYFEAPPGLHIRQVQLWRSLIDYGIGSGGTSQRNSAEVMADGQLPDVGDEFDGSADVPYGAAGSGDTTDNGIVPSNYLNMGLSAALPSKFAYVIGCPWGNGCPTGGNNPDVPGGFDTVLSIYGAIVSVEDDTPPTLTLGTTGLLDGAVQGGMAPLTINASAIAGIEKLEIYAGGSSAPAFTQDFTQSSHCQFWEVVPCQNLQNYQYPVDTTQLPNGTYYLTVKAYDPAGNVVAVSSAAPVTVENVLHVANGTPCAGEQLEVKVDGRRAPVTIGYARRARLTGVLRCGAGPMAGARVAISGGGLAASAMTGADGAFAYTVPSGHNRTLTITYTAYSNDPGPAATVRATVAVRPSIKLTITPRSTDNDGTITWRGRIRGGPYPAAGIPLQIQVREGTRWQTFDEISVPRDGQIGYRYTFQRTYQPTTYRFRVALPRGGAVGYPYASGASNVIAVRVS